MKEPFRSEFAELIRRGAGTLDIPDSTADTSFTKEIEAPAELIQREIDRVDVHRASLNVLLEALVGSTRRVLDVGCGTGATTVAMALSSRLGAEEVIGLDPNPRSIEAAIVRAKGYDLDEPRCSFRYVPAGAPLPYPDDGFDLTTCVSVIEYVPTVEQRVDFVRELKRVTRPGGHILLVTPSPFRLRDYHTHRLAGDWRRVNGYPWASPPWQLESMFDGCRIIPTRAHQIRAGLGKRNLPGELLPARLANLAGWALPWQKLLAQKL